MAKYQFSSIQRMAIWKAHKAKCAYCGELIFFNDLEIDHILPESLLDNPDDLERFKIEYGLGSEFGINSYYNWIPSCRSCNKRKSNKPFSESSARFYIEMVAKTKYEEIIKVEQNLEKTIKKEGFLTQTQVIKLIETETSRLVEEYIKDFVVNNLILSPATKRRDQWINEYLSKAVQTIAEKAAPSVVENLYTNESFLTVVLQATSIALRNHQKEKLEALRNAIVNSVLPNAPDDDLKLMFINCIDSFTLTHLVILDFIDHPLHWCQTKNLMVDNSMFQYRAGSTAQDSNKLSESTQTFLIKIFPDIDNQVYFYDQVLQDLMSKGLVDGGIGANISVLDLHGTAFSTTNMGKLFKRFVLSFPITETSV